MDRQNTRPLRRVLMRRTKSYAEAVRFATSYATGTLHQESRWSLENHWAMFMPGRTARY